MLLVDCCLYQLCKYAAHACMLLLSNCLVDSLWSLQVIEALHRKQNSVKNLTSNIRNKEAQMAAILDNEFHAVFVQMLCVKARQRSRRLRAQNAQEQHLRRAPTTAACLSAKPEFSTYKCRTHCSLKCTRNVVFCGLKLAGNAAPLQPCKWCEIATCWSVL